MIKNNKFPVLLITFKRYKDLDVIIKTVKKYKPPRLYVFSDAGRNKSEQQEVDKVRNVLADFKRNNKRLACKFLTAKSNMGVRDGIVFAINSVFRYEKELIILEDDCVPNDGFFKYCGHYLCEFRDNKKILSISGTRFGKDGDPVLSKYFTSWGWATWKDRWIKLDLELKSWKRMGLFQKIKFLFLCHGNVLGVWYWYNILEYTRKGKIVAWDYQFNFLHWLKGCYSVIPSTNLVVNNGFDINSTNTTFVHRHIPRENLKSAILTRSVSPSTEYDDFLLNSFYLYYLPVLGLITKYMFGFKNFTYFFNKIRHKINFTRRNKVHN